MTDLVHGLYESLRVHVPEAVEIDVVVAELPEDGGPLIAGLRQAGVTEPANSTFKQFYLDWLLYLTSVVLNYGSTQLN